MLCADEIISCFHFCTQFDNDVSTTAVKDVLLVSPSLQLKDASL